MKLLRDIRESYEWTTRDLSLKSGVQGCRIKEIEAGRLRPHESTAQLIADAVGLKVSDIYWPRGTTHLGKPARAGGRMKPNAQNRYGSLCDKCREEKSLSGECQCTD